MRCPNCGNEVPSRPTCLRCGVALFGSPVLPASALAPIRMPLTLAQKVQLFSGCLPVLGFVLLLAGYLALVQRAIVPPPVPFFYVFGGAVILVVGYQALQRLRDLLSGVALAREDLLKRSYRSRAGRGRSSCYGHFEQLGTLRMSPKDHVQHTSGQRYRVVYSPASKIVWALEVPDGRIWS
jgi:hypothetical protein